jgi:hypothetical protein
MNRSGYSDDVDGPEVHLWRGSVARAIRGKRGQAFLRELLDVLNAMPEKRLIADDLERDGEVCAIGSVGVKRGIDLTKLDPEEPEPIAKAFGIACALVQELEYINDEQCGWHSPRETPEQRHERVREWCAQNLRGQR